MEAFTTEPTGRGAIAELEELTLTMLRTLIGDAPETAAEARVLIRRVETFTAFGVAMQAVGLLP